MTISRIDQAGQGTSIEAAAIRAARSGRLDELESQLERMAATDAGRAREMGDKLRSLARSVLSHPASGRSEPGLRAAI
jgi:hypothetical protein